MDLATFIVVLFGAFSLIGGIIGFVKAQSKASLIAGSISGIALLVSAYGMSQGNQAASLASLVIALLLGLRFLRTWFKNRRLFPDFLMVLFSLVMFVLVGLKLING